MPLLDRLRSTARRHGTYHAFEQISFSIIIVFVALVVVDSLIFIAIKLGEDFVADIAFRESVILRDAFAPLLTVIILLELNHSIIAAMRARSGAIQVRIVVIIAIIVVARKIILLDYSSAGIETFLGIGGMLLALGVLYWLIADADRKRAVPAAASTAAAQRPTEGAGGAGD
jgi:uncharacterized membrane protein (DUF373 family)